MRILLTIIMLSICFVTSIWADVLLNEKLDYAVCYVESNFKVDAISFRGDKYGRGLMQVSEIVLKEWNDKPDKFSFPNIIHRKFTKLDLFDAEINTHIGDWYLNERIPQMLRHYGFKPTIENKLWAYNAGIGNVVKGIKPKETKDYIKKVLKIYNGR